MDTEASEATLGEAARSRSRIRLFLISFTALLVVIALAAIAAHSIQNFRQDALREQITRDLTQKAQAFAARLNTDRSSKLADLTAQVAQQAGARATVIDANGNVMADSQVPLAALEKEGERPEFVAALRSGIGVQVRSHGPVGVPVLYVSVPVSGGAVRLSTPLAEVETASAQARRALLWSCGVGVFGAFIISALIAYFGLR